MSHQQRRRNKRYIPRNVHPAGGIGVINCMREDTKPIDAHAMTDLGIAYWAAFHQMVHGKSREEDWSVIVVALNIALILSERGIGPEWEAHIVKALDGAFVSYQRAQNLHAWRFDGPALSNVREALEIHDEQVAVATKEDLRLALIEVNNRIAAGNVYRIAA
jgi:hypothetical protein